MSRFSSHLAAFVLAAVVLAVFILAAVVLALILFNPVARFQYCCLLLIPPLKFLSIPPPGFDLGAFDDR